MKIVFVQFQIKGVHAFAFLNPQTQLFYEFGARQYWFEKRQFVSDHKSHYSHRLGFELQEFLAVIPSYQK